MIGVGFMVKFQFLHGAIKRLSHLQKSATSLGFNSNMV